MCALIQRYRVVVDAVLNESSKRSQKFINPKMFSECVCAVVCVVRNIKTQEIDLRNLNFGIFFCGKNSAHCVATKKCAQAQRVNRHFVENCTFVLAAGMINVVSYMCVKKIISLKILEKLVL